MSATGRKKIKSQIEELRNEIRVHDQKYYVEADPSISDREYDRLMNGLLEIDRKKKRRRWFW